MYLCRLKNVDMEVDDTKNVVDLIRKTVLSVDPTARILLYGSRAKGTARQDSDWDIIVLVNDPDMNFDARSDISYDLWWKGLQIGEEINAFTYNTKQWETAPPSLFKFNVLKEHIEL